MSMFTDCNFSNTTINGDTFEDSDLCVLKEKLTKLEKQTNIIQLALAEMLENEMVEDTKVVAMAMIYTGYSAISQMYANMIEKGIYTIEKVPVRYREETKAVLEKNKEDEVEQ